MHVLLLMVKSRFSNYKDKNVHGYIAALTIAVSFNII